MTPVLSFGVAACLPACLVWWWCGGDDQLVIESPVPVLLDVYADWCGPCKQLTPALEEMAVRSGGMFRLAKLNSDKNRGVVEMLQVRRASSEG